ncbi:hypothetical protein PO909_017627 [Leuciscus waleckii]
MGGGGTGKFSDERMVKASSPLSRGEQFTTVDNVQVHNGGGETGEFSDERMVKASSPLSRGEQFTTVDNGQMSWGRQELHTVQVGFEAVANSQSQTELGFL